jgi:hypothetical protein
VAIAAKPFAAQIQNSTTTPKNGFCQSFDLAQLDESDTKGFSPASSEGIPVLLREPSGELL